MLHAAQTLARQARGGVLRAATANSRQVLRAAASANLNRASSSVTSVRGFSTDADELAKIKKKISEPFKWDAEQHWEDPFQYDDQLTDDEIMVRGKSENDTGNMPFNMTIN